MPIDEQQVQALSPLEFKARQVVEGFLAGLHKSPFHGFSVEFAEHRAYNPGDSTRHIDWKLYARTDKVFVKRYEEETNLRCQLVVDASSSMYFPELPKASSGHATMNKVQFAVHAAAALTQLMRKQRDAVGLTVFSDQIDQVERVRSNAVHLKQVMDRLEALLAEDAPATGRRTSVVEALNDLARRAQRRSLIVVFSDMMDNTDDEEAVFDALQHLRHNKHDVILFHVTDRRQEMELQLEDRPYTFVDKETGEEVKAHPAEVREAYRTAVTGRWHRLKIKCGQYRIDLVEADIHAGFNTVLLEFLLKRSRLY